MWNLCHCCATGDGKHIEIMCPRNGGSLFFNYKKYHSIVMMALCDAKYKLLKTNIGGFGSDCDAGLFSQTTFGQKLLANTFNLPQDAKLTKSDTKFPYFIVGDSPEKS